MIAAATFAANCASVPRIALRGKAVVPVAADEMRGTAKVALFNEVTIKLPPITAPGYEWTVVFNDIRYLKPLRAVEPASDGGFTATFLAVKQGRRLIRFFALPPALREATPAQSYELIVDIE